MPDQEITYYPATLKRQPSYARIYDTLTKSAEYFYPTKVLGSGSYGQARLFTSAAGRHLTVKAPIMETLEFRTRKEREQAAKAINREFVLLTQASANKNQLALALKRNNKTISDENGKPIIIYQLTYRMVQPFIEGKELREHAEKHVNQPKEMALLMLNVAKEINRIHRCGVIHGDVSSRNILVKHAVNQENVSVSCIDFGLAYFSDEMADVGYTKTNEYDSQSITMAPERFTHKKIPAHPSQDVYSLAMTFQKLMENRSAAWITEFSEKYSGIMQFITEGLEKVDAHKRPSLPDFIASLQTKLDNPRQQLRLKGR